MAQDSGLGTQPRIVGAAVATLAALAYVNALANGLVWDDPIVLNRQLLAFRSLYDLIITPRNIPQYSPDYYRPLTTLSYLLDRAIGGTAPFMFHFSVVIYHVLATYLVFRLGIALFGASESTAAALGAALFAVHPIHTESVAWGAGRSDVLACCCAVGATLAGLQRAGSGLQRAGVAAGLAFASLLAKETAIGLLVLLPAAPWILGRQMVAAPRRAARAERRRQREPAPAPPSPLLYWLPFAAALVVYIALRQAAIGSVAGAAAPVGAEVVAKLLAAVGVYISKLFLPFRQSAYISDLPTSPLALAASALALGAAGALLLRAWQRGWRAVSFLLLWTLVTLVPSFAIVVKIPAAPIAERYLYLPSVGFCLLVGYGAAQVLRRAQQPAARRALVATYIVIGAAAALATVQRNAVWRTILSLWGDTSAKNTTDGLPMRSLAAAHLEAGDTATASESFQRALQRRNDPIGKFTIYNNLGSIALSAKRLDEADGHYRTALQFYPNAADSLFNLGLIALTRATDAASVGEAENERTHAREAQTLFERAERFNPLDPDIQVALGQTLTHLGETAAARAHLQRALDLGLPAPTDASVRNLLSQLN